MRESFIPGECMVKDKKADRECKDRNAYVATSKNRLPQKDTDISLTQATSSQQREIQLCSWQILLQKGVLWGEKEGAIFLSQGVSSAKKSHTTVRPTSHPTNQSLLIFTFAAMDLVPRIYKDAEDSLFCVFLDSTFV